jgi:ketosteroid isomerase-like protein
MSEVGDGVDPGSLVQTYCERWAARDKLGCLGLMSSNVVWALYVPQEVLPFGGETRGVASISDRLQMVLDQFDTLNYRGFVTRTQGNIVSGQVAYRFRHKITGEDIEGVMRVVATIENGSVARWDEYHDVEKVKAFMRLIAYTASDPSMG